MGIEKKYNDEEELIEDLKKWGLLPEEISKAISHEKAHIDKAKEFGCEHLGYIIDIFSVEKLPNGKFRQEIYISPLFKGYVNATNLREIVLAPEYPSKGDIETADKCSRYSLGIFLDGKSVKYE